MIIKAEGAGTVILDDIMFLCKSVDMHNYLTGNGCKSMYIDSTQYGMNVMRSIDSECFVLIGEFSEEEITLVRVRCRPVRAKRVLVVSPSLNADQIIIIQKTVGIRVEVVIDKYYGRELLPKPESTKEPELRTDHSYKAVKERTKFFR